MPPCLTAVLTTLCLGAPLQSIEAPMLMVTDHGLELASSERIFVLFAALNAAGYSEEPKRKGPPLDAPVFHPIRQEIRDLLRDADDLASFGRLQIVFDRNPESIEAYLEAVLSLEYPVATAEHKTTQLASKLKLLDSFQREASLREIFDKLVPQQRAHMKSLKAALEKDFRQAARILGEDSLRAPTSLVVIPNLLDGHDITRSVRLGGNVFLITGPTGPDLKASRSAILRIASREHIHEMIKRPYKRAAKLARSWSTLKTSKRITRVWSDGESYLTDALTRSLAHRVLVPKPQRELDETFIEAQSKDGMRWARAALRMLDEERAGSLARALPRLLIRAAP